MKASDNGRGVHYGPGSKGQTNPGKQAGRSWELQLGVQLSSGGVGLGNALTLDAKQGIGDDCGDTGSSGGTEAGPGLRRVEQPAGHESPDEPQLGVPVN
eukprot:7034897-Alexandrium_andersonii.AAC.1